MWLEQAAQTEKWYVVWGGVERGVEGCRGVCGRRRWDGGQLERSRVGDMDEAGRGWMWGEARRG